MSGREDSVIPICLRQAVLDAFKTQVGVEIEMDNASIQDRNLAVECMSVIALKSDVYTGSLSLGFPGEVYLNVLEKMFGERPASISDENADGCSELLNIIYASARLKINEAGFNFEPSIPTAVHGKGISIALPESSKVLRIGFNGELGNFNMVLNLRQRK